MAGTEQYVIRTAKKEEITLFTDWFAAEQWNTCPRDVRMMQEVDPESVLVGEYMGEVIACITGFKYDDTYAYISYYVVKPEFRGQGFGLPLFRACQARLKTCAVLSLHSAPGLEATYQRSGFSDDFEVNMIYRGFGAKDGSQEVAHLVSDSFSVIPIRECPRHGDVAKYDTESQACSAPRETMLKTLLGLADQDGFVAISKEAKNAECVVGYVLLDRNATGFRVGPFVADSPEIATSLFTALRLLANSGQTLTIVIPSLSIQAQKMVGAAGFPMLLRVQRMCTATPSAINFNKTYASGSLGLGY